MKQIIACLLICVFYGSGAMQQAPEIPIPNDRRDQHVQMQPTHGLHLNELSEEAQRRVDMYFIAGTDPSLIPYYWWRGIRAICNPTHNLASVLCAVGSMIPVAQNINKDLAISICAIAAFVFKNIDGYADDRIAYYENIRLHLDFMRANPLLYPEAL